MTLVPTATGTADVGRLSSLLYHEHVAVDMSHVADMTDYCLPGADVMVSELRRFVDSGGGGVISLTNRSMGRDLAVLRQVSERSGAVILVATGLYTRTSAEAAGVVEDRRSLARRFVGELTVGIEDTGIRASVIGEIATGSWPIGPYERALFDAAAEAHLETGAPIATHTFAGRHALWQLSHLMRRGVAPERIAIGHLDERLVDGDIDLQCLREIAEQGAYVGLDSVGCTYFSEFLGVQQPTDAARADVVAKLVEWGLGDRLLLSHDICRPRHLAINGGIGYAHIFDSFIPLLEQRGVSRDSAWRLVKENPLRWLTDRRA